MKEYFSELKEFDEEKTSFSFKDCISVKGMNTSASSKILEGYKPLYDSTVSKKVKEKGYQIVGKTIQDEFGFGSFCTNTGKGIKPPKNPVDKERVTGGSSGGAAGAAKSIKNHIAIAESTGGSIANPAAFCEVVGLTPTYGLVGRHGLIDYANSLDKIGVIANSVRETAFGLKTIAGYDGNDSTSVKVNIPDYEKPEKPVKVTLGVVKEYLEACNDSVKEAFQNKLKEIKEQGIEVKEVSLSLNKEYSVSTYYIIAMSEASTNLARYTGLRYGYSEELKGNYKEYTSKVRSNAFGDEAKRRIILGTYARMAGYRDQYYDKALRVRTKLLEEYKEKLKGIDGLIHPTMPIHPPIFKEIEKLSLIETYNMDLLTTGANLAGLPHISIPIKSELPVGLMITMNHFEEEKLISIGGMLE